MLYRLVKLTVATLLIASFALASLAEKTESAKELSFKQLCESTSDFPMTSDQQYRGKRVKSSINVSSSRKILTACKGDEIGMFTVEFIATDDYVVQCVCTSPEFEKVLKSTEGSELGIEGIFESLTSVFFETETKQCKITLNDCTFKQ